MKMNYNVRQLHKRFDKIEKTLDIINKFGNPDRFTLNDLYNKAKDDEQLVLNYEHRGYDFYGRPVGNKTHISGIWLTSLANEGILECIGKEIHLWRHKEYIRGKNRMITEEIEVNIYKVVKNLTDYKIEIINSL